MVPFLGYALLAASAFMLFSGYLVLGCALFCFGGGLAGGLHLSLRSLGVLMLVGGVATAYHHGFSVPVFIVLVVGVILANRRRSGRRRGDDGWGLDIGIDDFFDGGGDGGGCGGGCGGCGGG